jgi:hypothetical protein
VLEGGGNELREIALACWFGRDFLEFYLLFVILSIGLMELLNHSRVFEVQAVSLDSSEED